ncbi:MAG: molybdopterin-dependent oxidoreductase [Phototrophicaceae bacterium]
MATYQPFQQQLYRPPHTTSLDTILIVDGFVNIPLTFSSQDFSKLPLQHLPSVITCDKNQLLYEREWGAVCMVEVVERAQPTLQARFMQFISADGYTTSLPLEDAPHVFIATHQHDQPLTPEHGGHYRLIVRGRYGYKQPKWLSQIYFVATPTLGFWEQRGASQDGWAMPRSTLETIQLSEEGVLLGGVAWGGKHPLHSVRILLDGETALAQLTQEGSSSLYHWALAWQPKQRRTFHIQVCAVNQHGESEPPTSQPKRSVKVSA